MGFFMPAITHITDPAKTRFILKHQPYGLWGGKGGYFFCKPSGEFFFNLLDHNSRFMVALARSQLAPAMTNSTCFMGHTLLLWGMTILFIIYIMCALLGTYELSVAYE
ncbi:hypothetical protein [Mycoavidus sp. B2-EB]|uniref:hypothetical protein n=1 Tax=Mycoavidus sp. B2-EB TaxID=2651972 RepID=UPI001627701D|nr:hypothetical protein [Mycoavidus sp. B2-EB]